MANPTSYSRGYSFTGFQQSTPADPLPADKLDAELDGVATAVGQTQSALSDIRRSDGALVDGIVTADTLDAAFLTDLLGMTADQAATIAANTAVASAAATSATASEASAASSLEQVQNIAAGVLPIRGDWTTGTAYTPSDIALSSGSSYACLVAHTSGTFATDLAAGKWQLLAAQGPNGAGTGDMLAANNLSDLVDAAAARTNLGVALGSQAQAWSAVLDAVAAVVASKVILPSGMVNPFAMSTAPAGWLECNGSAVSRTTYADLFAAIGSAYGVGDGSTTFNLPDMRGQFVRGWDHGAGVDSGRAFASAQTDAIKSHGHGISDPGHTHGVYDPGHLHGIQGQIYDGNGSPGGASFAATAGNLNRSGSTANTSGTGIGIYGSGTGVSIQASGGTETRPKNVALMYCIKT